VSREWLDALQDGSQVIISNRYARYVATVSKATPTLIRIVDGQNTHTFSRKTGYRTGYDDPWNSTSIQQATPEALEEIRIASHRATLIRRIELVHIKSLPTGVLEALCAALAKGVEP